jgi:hypothetical protein
MEDKSRGRAKHEYITLSKRAYPILDIIESNKQTITKGGTAANTNST